MAEANYWTRLNQNRASRRRFLAASGAAGAGLTAAALVGCGDDDDGGDASTPDGQATGQVAAQPKRGGIFRSGAIGYPTTFNPLLSGASPIRSRVNSRLFITDTGPNVPDITARVVPDAAESFEQPDPTTLNVKIRSNLKFGAPVNRVATAEDVAYSFDRYTGKIAGVAPSPEAGDRPSLDAPPATLPSEPPLRFAPRRAPRVPQ